MLSPTYICDLNTCTMMIGKTKHSGKVVVPLEEAIYVLSLVEEHYKVYQRDISDRPDFKFSGIDPAFCHRIHHIICKNPYHNSIGEEKDCIEDMRNILVLSTNELEQKIVTIFRKDFEFLFVEKALVDFLLHFYRLCKTVDIRSS